MSLRLCKSNFLRYNLLFHCHKLTVGLNMMIYLYRFTSDKISIEQCICKNIPIDSVTCMFINKARARD